MLLLLFLILMISFSFNKAAIIFPCSDGTKRDASLQFPENKPFAVCCELEETECKVTTLNDTLTLLPEIDCNGSCAAEQQMIRQNACLVKFEVYNASSMNQGIYFCIKNEEIFTRDKVFIVKKPTQPVIISFTCTQNFTYNVTFDRGTQVTTYNDSYSVCLQRGKSGKEKTICPCNKTRSICNNNTCTCKFSIDDRPLRSDTVTIIVIVERSVVLVEARKNYAIPAVVLPGPIKHLRAVDVNQSDASFHFCMDKATVEFFGFMADTGTPLYFHMLVIKMQGVPEILNVTLPSNANCYPACKCMLVCLPNLTAFTRYKVIVSNSGGGGEGVKGSMEFDTTQAVPFRPPKEEEILFSRTEGRIDNDTVVPALNIVWKSLPRDDIGGSDLRYHIEIAGEHCININKTVFETYLSIADENLQLGSCTAKIWAQNAVGSTEKFTTIQIPPKPDTAVPAVFVEINGETALVHVRQIDLDVNTTLNIHWCNGYTDEVNGIHICKEYPQTATYTIKNAVREVQMFEVNLGKAEEERKNEMSQRVIKFYDLQCLDADPVAEHITNATVTLNPASVIQHESYDDTFDENYLRYYYFDSSRKRRNVGLNLHSVVKRQTRELLQSETLQKDDSSVQIKNKFFISLPDDDVLRDFGMIPARCYFDKTKDKVSLIFSYSQDENTKATIMRWTQECNINPSQFLAENFNVYVGTDEHCSSNNTFVGKVQNKIFEPNFMKLPENSQFVCIKSCKGGSPEICSPEMSSYSVRHALQGDDSRNSIIIISVIIPVVVVIAAAVFLCYCRSRKKHIQLFAVTQLKLPECNDVNIDLNGEKTHSSVPALPDRTNEKPNLSVSLSDSGRGSDLSELERKNLSDSCLTKMTTVNTTGVGSAEGFCSTQNAELHTDEESREDMNEDSDSDSGGQMKELEKCGFSFKINNESGSSHSARCAESDTDTDSSGTVENLSSSSSVSVKDSSSTRESTSENVFQHVQQGALPVAAGNSFIRMLSSESESEPDSDKPLIKTRRVFIV